jgi:hypothetical protein
VKKGSMVRVNGRFDHVGKYANRSSDSRAGTKLQPIEGLAWMILQSGELKEGVETGAKGCANQ